MKRSASDPLVSVVLPTYNRASSIRSSIQSVLYQSISNFELIVVDDCSEDHTLEILESIKDPRLRVIRLEQNGGASQARNTGIQASRGNFVAFQDSDDEWLPQKLEKQLTRLTRPDSKFIGAYCGMIILRDSDGHRRSRTSVTYFPDGPLDRLDGDLMPELLKRSIVSTQTLIARRRALLASGKFDPELPALVDWDYMLRFARHGHIAFLDEPLVVQRFSANSISLSWHNRVIARQQIVEKNMDLLAERRQLLAAHFHAIGGGYAGLAETKLARRFLRHALQLSPFKVRTWLSLLRTFGVFLHRQRSVHPR